MKEFRSLEPGKVKMFVCGPTIQDYIHVGHARTYLFYDMLARYLRYLGNAVELVVNITDIDESIVKRARSEGKSIREFTEEHEAGFASDMKGLGINAVAFDRVSDHVKDMIVQVQGLLDRGNAYRLGGNVYFSIDTFPGFGRLSKQSSYEISLRPLEIAEGKRNQADFSLWRESSKEEQRWESPWGLGTPGWHIQDTAVSYSHFGGQYDIHGGARELVYPHHEAQIAEVESLTGRKPFVGYWVHSGLLTQRREKMAKSRGNVLRVREVLKEHSQGALRLYLLSMHHRKDAEFRERELRRWESRYSELRSNAGKIRSRAGGRSKEGPLVRAFLAALNDDLRTDRAIGMLVKEVSGAAKDGDPKRSSEALGLVEAASGILGVGLAESD